MKNKKYFILYFLFLLPFIGSQCDSIFETGNTEIYGRWQLIYNSGNLHDICPGETINFQNNGIAIQKCPNRDSIQVGFTIQNTVLTYSSTNLQYNIYLRSDTLDLQGVSINRVLTYLRINN